MQKITLSSKGQMIVPKYIREALSLVPGADLRIELINAQSFTVWIEPKRTHKQHVEHLAGCLRRPGKRRPVSITEMDAAVLKIAREEDERTKRRPRR